MKNGSRVCTRHTLVHSMTSSGKALPKVMVCLKTSDNICFKLHVSMQRQMPPPLLITSSIRKRDSSQDLEVLAINIMITNGHGGFLIRHPHTHVLMYCSHNSEAIFV